MTPEFWCAVEKLYFAVLELEPADRTAFLNDNCADEQLRQEVESLLGYQELGEYLLDQRPWQPAATPNISGETSSLSPGAAERRERDANRVSNSTGQYNSFAPRSRCALRPVQA